jgi:RimJ/RimL family protein N-acetyltransferase
VSGVEIARFGPDDAEQVAAYAEIMTAARAVDAPWQPPMTLRRAEARLRHGWDGEVEVPFLGVVDATPVGVATVAVSEYDNLQLAWLGVAVHPDHRRRGYGSALLDHLLAQTQALGRTLVGIDGWDSDATRGFAARHGFEQKSVAVQRQQRLADLDWDELTRLHDEARAAASAYDLERWEGRTPDDQLAALGELTEAINDAPTDDLELEDEVYPPERVRGYEDAQLAAGFRLYRVVARHRDTGRLGGHTVVVVDEEAPARGWQHDTAVPRAHRGHRLGLLLKAEMNLWLRDAEPQLEVVSTFNAESNDHMIGVNERLGYRVVGRELEFQRPL